MLAKSSTVHDYSLTAIDSSTYVKADRKWSSAEMTCGTALFDCSCCIFDQVYLTSHLTSLYTSQTGCLCRKIDSASSVLDLWKTSVSHVSSFTPGVEELKSQWRFVVCIDRFTGIALPGNSFGPCLFPVR